MKEYSANSDAFSKCHPAVNFLFFLGAIVMAAVIQHPVYLLVGLVTGVVYYLLLNGRKGIRTILLILPIPVLITVVNPLFNTLGDGILFSVFGRPYTLEALLYGGALGGILLVMILWFGCYNKVLTGDKFTALFGNLIPSVSLLLVMVFRLVPNFIRKTRQIAGARKAIGKGGGDQTSNKEKLRDGLTVLGTLTAWALEGGVITGDSMRARGYGTAKRTGFMIYRMTLSDWLLLGFMIVLLVLSVIAAVLGQVNATFTPYLQIAPISWGLPVYACYLLIPTGLHIKETIQWHISRSKI